MKQLPAASTRGGMALAEALDLRQSVREFTGHSIPLEDLAQILWACQGRNRQGGGRTAPTAYGAYPVEVHVLVNDVEGLHPGVYRYDAGTVSQEHRLAGGAAVEQETLDALDGDISGEQALLSAPVALILTGDRERALETYPDPAEIDRWLPVDAAMAAQNVLLTATSLRLGSVPMGDFREDVLRRLLHLPDQFTPLLILPVGVPKL